MERSKESALKAIAKRPKLFPLLMKGGHTIHELKKIGQCSGGLIRTIIWAGLAVVNEDKTIKFVKGVKQSDLPSLDEVKAPKKKEVKKVSKPVKAEKKAKASESRKPAPKPSKVSAKPSKKAKIEDEDEIDPLEDTRAAKAAKRDIKAGK